MEEKIHCDCGMLLKDGRCTRKPSVKACRGEVRVRKPKYSGKSKSEFAFNEYK